MDEELEQARKKRLADARKAQENEEQIRSTMRMILDEDAYARMMNVRVASPELYARAVQGCAGLFQRLGRKLGEREVLLVLRRMIGEEHETRITFERK